MSKFSFIPSQPGRHIHNFRSSLHQKRKLDDRISGSCSQLSKCCRCLSKPSHPVWINFWLLILIQELSKQAFVLENPILRLESDHQISEVMQKKPLAKPSPVRAELVSGWPLRQLQPTIHSILPVFWKITCRWRQNNFLTPKDYLHCISRIWLNLLMAIRFFG